MTRERNKVRVGRKRVHGSGSREEGRGGGVDLKGAGWRDGEMGDLGDGRLGRQVGVTSVRLCLLCVCVKVCQSTRPREKGDDEPPPLPRAGLVWFFGAGARPGLHTYVRTCVCVHRGLERGGRRSSWQGGGRLGCGRGVDGVLLWRWVWNGESVGRKKA
jgi:hypothetical protein